MTPLRPAAVEIRLDERSRRLAQYLIRPAKLPVLPFQCLERLSLFSLQPRPCTPIALRRPLRIMLRLVLQHEANRPLPYLREIPLVARVPGGQALTAVVRDSFCG